MAYIGVKYPVYSPLTAETAGSAPTYGTGAVAGHLIKVDFSPEYSDAKLYADNRAVESDNGMTGGKITVGTDHLTDAVAAALLGLNKISSTGTEVLRDDQPAPYVGFGYIFNTVQGGVKGYVARWFYKVQFQQDSDNHETRADKTQFSTPEIVGALMAVEPASGKTGFFCQQAFDDEDDAIDYLNTKAGITTGSGGSGGSGG